jgi:iron complex transport system substrate-binding protein
MKRMTAVFLVLVVCLALAAVGCFRPKDAQPAKADTAYTVTDSEGHSIKLAQKPQRIVSLSIGTDEILVDMVPPVRIAALSYLSDNAGISNITEQAKQVPRKIKANAETVIGLQPDLVFVPSWLPAELGQIMRDAGLAVYVYKTPNSIEQVKQTVAEIARAVGEEEAGQRIIAGMEAELAKVRRKVEKVPPGERQVVVQFSLMGGSGGKGSTFDDLCRYAGVDNGAAIAGLRDNEILSKEQIVRINPDLLILPTWDYTGKTDPQQYKDAVRTDPGFQSVKAVQRQRLVQISDRYLVSSSPYIVYGVQELAKAAYPRYFGQ